MPSHVVFKGLSFDTSMAANGVQASNDLVSVLGSRELDAVLPNARRDAGQLRDAGQVLHHALEYLTTGQDK